MSDERYAIVRLVGEARTVRVGRRSMWRPSQHVGWVVDAHFDLWGADLYLEAEGASIQDAAQRVLDQYLEAIRSGAAEPMAGPA